MNILYRHLHICNYTYISMSCSRNTTSRDGRYMFCRTCSWTTLMQPTCCPFSWAGLLWTRPCLPPSWQLSYPLWRITVRESMLCKAQVRRRHACMLRLTIHSLDSLRAMLKLHRTVLCCKSYVTNFALCYGAVVYMRMKLQMSCEMILLSRRVNSRFYRATHFGLCCVATCHSVCSALLVVLQFSL